MEPDALVKKLYMAGMISQAMLCLTDVQIIHHLPTIIDEEIKLFYHIKGTDSVKVMRDRHMDGDLKAGRVKFMDEGKPPEGMYN